MNVRLTTSSRKKKDSALKTRIRVNMRINVYYSNNVPYYFLSKYQIIILSNAEYLFKYFISILKITN